MKKINQHTSSVLKRMLKKINEEKGSFDFMSLESCFSNSVEALDNSQISLLSDELQKIQSSLASLESDYFMESRDKYEESYMITIDIIQSSLSFLSKNE